MYQFKDESDHIYGDYRVIAKTEYREITNGCIMWKCECQNCGYTKIINGNSLRFSKYKHCPNCKGRR